MMLASAAEVRTVIDDWLVRRQRLAASETVPEQYRQVQLQVLEYLIRRYGDSAEAARPARFASSDTFYSNDRVVVVHHHLGRGKIAGVRNQAEANQRVGDILKHLQRVHEETEDIEAHNDFASWVDELDQRPETPTSAWRDIWWQLKPGSTAHGGTAHGAISAALEKSPYLPRAALAYLCRCLSQSYDMVAAELLLKCCSDRVPDYVARAWRERVNAGWVDLVTANLRDYLAKEPRALDGIRERLADANPAVRLAATELLRDAGTLDDVSLLSDLVSLPHAADEHSYERRALLYAIWVIAHRA